MSEKRKDKNENNKTIKARRRIIKAIAGTSGAVVAGKALPENWTRPAIDMALLPAHAQTSVCTEICNLDIRLQWSARTAIDLDLELLAPGGQYIAPKPINGVIQGNCLQHDGDHLGDSGGVNIETISNIGTGVSPGHYAVYLRNNEAGGWSGVNIQVSGCIDLVPSPYSIGPDTVLRLFSFDIPEVP